MKRTTLVVLAMAAALGTSVHAAEDRPSDKKPPATRPDARATSAMDKQMAQMDEQMKKMQEQMSRIQKTTDPRERQKLMREHIKTMRQGMGTMRGPAAAMAGGMMGDGGKAPDTRMWSEMQQQQGYMEKRMHMMQMMMDHMMQMMQFEPAK